MLHAADDADDRAPGPGVAEAQLLSDGVAVRPEPARQGLVHDDDERGVLPIAGLEQAAAAEPRTHGLEVARRRRADARHRLPLIRPRLAALDDEDLRHLAVAERRRRREARAPHAGQRGHARVELRIERPRARLIAALRQVLPRHRHAAHEHALRPEAGIHGQQLAEAAQQQRRHDQQHHRQGELRHHERVRQPAAGRAARRPPAVAHDVVQVDRARRAGRGRRRRAPRSRPSRPP